MKLSSSIELRAPVNPADSEGDYLVLPPGADTPKTTSARGGYFRAATDGAPAMWLGKVEYGDQPGQGVLGERVIADIGIKHWLAEFRAKPQQQRWDAEEALLRSRPVAQQLLGWILRFQPESQVVNGRILPEVPPPAPVFEPPMGMRMEGQASGWLANADSPIRVRAETSRWYIRRDALVRYLTQVPWPDGKWTRKHPSVAQKILDNGEADWHGLIEADPPTGIGPLHGLDPVKRKLRRLWSAAEILAWGLEGWRLRGAWLPEQTISAPMQVLRSACAPLCSLATFLLFHEMVVGEPKLSGRRKHTPTMSWLTSRGRALAAPAAKALNDRFIERSDGNMYGQHIGALYITIPDDSLPDVYQAAQAALPEDRRWLMPPGLAWLRAEEAHPEAARMGEAARTQISHALDEGPLPDEAWRELLSFGSTEQILLSDRQGQERRFPPAYTAAALSMPTGGGIKSHAQAFEETERISSPKAEADLRMVPNEGPAPPPSDSASILQPDPMAERNP